MSTDQSLASLIEQAVVQRTLAYAPYSSFAVGAAVEAVDGRIFTGCNVENGSYGLSLCAERVALVRAVAAGIRQFTRIVIVATPLAPPCGACRQVMSEFFGDDVLVYSVDAATPGTVRSWTMDQLLPDRFRFDK